MESAMMLIHDGLRPDIARNITFFRALGVCVFDNREILLPGSKANRKPFSKIVYLINNEEMLKKLEEEMQKQYDFRIIVTENMKEQVIKLRQKYGRNFHQHKFLYSEKKEDQREYLIRYLLPE